MLPWSPFSNTTCTMADRQNRRRQLARRRIYWRNVAINGRRLFDPTNPIAGMTDDEVYARYRFRPQTIQLIMTVIGGVLLRESGRGLPPLLQVLCTIRFLATGSFQQVIGDPFNIHASTACRTIHNVCEAFTRLAPQYCHFPTRERRHELKQLFFQLPNGGRQTK